MDNDTPENTEKNAGYIPGIYNYCDRWCDRCRFTARCRIFNMELEGKSDATTDIPSDQLWDEITESLQETLDLIEEIARQEGIDLEAIESVESGDGADVIHILSVISDAYVQKVEKWFEENTRLIETGFKNHADHSHLKVVSADGDNAPISLKEALQVIRWYPNPIHIKLSRALRSKKNEAKYRFDDAQKDSDGSAKIALIGMDRSISAWGGLLHCFKSRRKEILEIIRYLKRIRDITENEFPNARNFIRPGFDETE